jgi:hypothetical protein
MRVASRGKVAAEAPRRPVWVDIVGIKKKILEGFLEK